MALHHLALRSPDPATLAAYYQRVLGLVELRRSTDDTGLYSVWLDLGGTILMVERGHARTADQGWDGMYLVAHPGSGPAWSARLEGCCTPIEGRTAFTLYARDPEGNRFGVSSFPDPLFNTLSQGS